MFNSVMTITAIMIAATMCLQGGEQVDVSQYVPATASRLELKVTLKSATGVLVVYSPGYEEGEARFTQRQSFGWIPFAEPVLCIKAIGGPFDFSIDIMPMEEGE
jgi:hypothetical protein